MQHGHAALQAQLRVAAPAGLLDRARQRADQQEREGRTDLGDLARSDAPSGRDTQDRDRRGGG